MSNVKDILTPSCASASASASAVDKAVSEMAAQAASKNVSIRDIAQVSRTMLSAPASTREYANKLSLCHIEVRTSVLS